MAGFVSQNIDVSARAVEIAEDERCLVGRKAGHIAAHPFAGAGLEVEQPVIDHEIKEFTGLRAHLTVHILCLSDKFLHCADRIGIPLRVQKRFVIVAELVHAQTLLLFLTDSRDCRCYDLKDLSAEIRCVLCIVIKAAALQIGKFGIGGESKRISHPIAEMYELVVLCVQLGTDLFIKSGPCLERFPALVTVGALHMLEQSVEIAFLTAKIGRGYGAVLLILLAELAFPDDRGDHTLVGGLK